MSCFRPLHAFPYDSNSSKFGQYRVYSHTINIAPSVDLKTGQLLEQIDIPCGKCVGCRLDYSRQWATRMVMESMLYKHNYFITLTYSNEYMDSMPEKYKNVDGAYTLYPNDLSAFIKRLRRKFEYELDHVGVRFYACGEYGSKTFRPHFHICLFNAPIPDCIQVGNNKIGQPLFDSNFVSSLWPCGHICIGELNWQTCAYTARYTMKKAGGQDAEYYRELNLNPEFVRMSRRPGIGFDYFCDHQDSFFDNDKIVLPATSKDKRNVQKIPTYFVKKMQDLDPVSVASSKARRAEAGRLYHEAKMSKIGLEEEEYFELEERRCSDRLKSLIREI